MGRPGAAGGALMGPQRGMEISSQSTLVSVVRREQDE